MFESGDVVGSWTLEERLGDGASATVWRGVRGGEVAAVKIHRLPLDGEDGERRFRREARVLQHLSHPAVVRCVEVDVDARHGIGWMAMSYVAGEGLDDRLARGPMTAEEARQAFGDLAEGLEHAHHRGVFHRDLKPSNVRLRPDGHAVVVDFGVALQEGATALTRDGIVHGTVAYLPPELFDRGARPDPRLGDVYALGLMLHEALVGAVAFPEDPSLDDRQQAVRIVGAKLEAGAMDPGDGVDPELRRLVQVATHPDPSLRIASMTVFADRLAGRKRARQAPRASQAHAGTIWFGDDDEPASPLDAPPPPPRLSGVAMPRTVAPRTGSLPPGGEGNDTRFFRRDALGEGSEPPAAPPPAAPPPPPPVTRSLDLGAPPPSAPAGGPPDEGTAFTARPTPRALAEAAGAGDDVDLDALPPPPPAPPGPPPVVERRRVPPPPTVRTPPVASGAPDPGPARPPAPPPVRRAAVPASPIPAAAATPGQAAPAPAAAAASRGGGIPLGLLAAVGAGAVLGAFVAAAVGAWWLGLFERPLPPAPDPVPIDGPRDVGLEVPGGAEALWIDGGPRVPVVDGVASVTLDPGEHTFTVGAGPACDTCGPCCACLEQVLVVEAGEGLTLLSLSAPEPAEAPPRAVALALTWPEGVEPEPVELAWAPEATPPDATPFVEADGVWTSLVPLDAEGVVVATVGTCPDAVGSCLDAEDCPMGCARRVLPVGPVTCGVEPLALSLEVDAPETPERPRPPRRRVPPTVDRDVVEAMLEGAPAPPPILTVSVTARTTGGAADAGLVRKVLQARVGAVERCWKALPEPPPPLARARVSLRVQRGGDFAGTTLESSTGEPSMDACVLRNVEASSLAKGQKPGKVEADFTFDIR